VADALVAGRVVERLVVHGRAEAKATASSVPGGLGVSPKLPGDSSA
jgi:hypothetical protein